MAKKLKYNAFKSSLWKFTTFFLLFVLLVYSFDFSKVGKRETAEQVRITATTDQVRITPTTTPQTRVDESDISVYPSALGAISKGKVSIVSEDTYKNGYFELSLQPFFRVNSENSEIVYKIPLTNKYIDQVSKPRISHNEKFGCVTMQSSGYSGYYIFSLPDGAKISEGKQYSQCIEWINSNQVIIAEQLYNTNDISYYILDASNKSKTTISTFSIE